MEKQNIIIFGETSLLDEFISLLNNEGYIITGTDLINNLVNLFSEKKACCLIFDAAIFESINYLDFYNKIIPRIKPSHCIILTESDSDIWMKKLFTLGFSSFIRKPVHSIELLGTIRNLSIINKLENALSCNTDNLTKLPNKAQFTLDIHSALSLSRQSNNIIAVLSLYFEQFKMINDQTGNQGGDVILKEIAVCLKSCVQNNGLVARTGGVEFSVLLTDISNKKDIVKTVELIETALLNPFYYNTHEFQLKFSIGISVYPGDGGNAEQLYANAENARVYSKENNNHRFQFYNNDIYLESFKQLKMENNLRNAIDRDEFVLHFQPQINLINNRVESCEAFIRWQHPERELLASREFINLAEQTGLILPIGEWVAYSACTQAKSWLDGGIKNPISINISSSQFNRKNCLELIEKALIFTKLPPAFLEVELTESMILADIHNAVTLCKDLKTLGVSLAIDDFGTGFSSINYLKKLCIDKIKIDKHFIQRIGHDPENDDIIKAAISMSHGLNIKVIAEGVETIEQKRFLAASHCDSAQGYLFCKPVSAKEYVYYLGAEKALIVHP